MCAEDLLYSQLASKVPNLLRREIGRHKFFVHPEVVREDSEHIIVVGGELPIEARITLQGGPEVDQDA